MANWAVFVQSPAGCSVVLSGLRFEVACRKVVEFSKINPSFEYYANTL